MYTRVSLETNVRTVHKLYEALVGARSGMVLNVEDDASLKQLRQLCEMILETSRYMTPAEILAIRAPLHGVWEVKG